MIASYEPDTWIMRRIQAALLSRLRPALVRLGRQEYRWLVEQSCSLRLTVNNDPLPIFEAYRRDHPEAVPMQYVACEGQTYPEITRRTLLHMRSLKRAFGVSHIDGVPIERVDEPGLIHVVSEPWGTA